MNTEEITELTNTIIAAEKRGWNAALEAVLSALKESESQWPEFINSLKK